MASNVLAKRDTSVVNTGKPEPGNATRNGLMLSTIYCLRAHPPEESPALVDDAKLLDQQRLKRPTHPHVADVRDE
jgi:hypothetical protein